MSHFKYLTSTTTIFPLPFHFPTSMRNKGPNTSRYMTRLLARTVEVHDHTISSATDLRAIPRTSQHTLFIYRLATIMDTITTPLKSELLSGEESSSKRRSETRTAFVCELHTCHRVARSPARTSAAFDAVLFWTAFDECPHG